MLSTIPLPVIAFFIPFLIAFSYPLLVMCCVPKCAPPKRYIQNNLSISIFLFSSFPISVGVFAHSITREAVAPWFAPGFWSYSSYALIGITIVIVTAIVFQDFMGRPMAPYVLKRSEAEKACQLEEELRAAFSSGVDDDDVKAKKREYQTLTRLPSFRDLFARGGPIAYVHIGLAWMGIIFAATYFWYLVVAAEYKFDGNKLKAGSENNLVLVLILLATFIPLRLQTEWYQSYFHEKNWLKKYPAFFLGIFLAIAMLLLLTLLLHPTFAVGFFSAFYAVLLGALGFIGKIKPEWLRGLAEFLREMTFTEFLALYIVFLVVISTVTVAAIGI